MDPIEKLNLYMTMWQQWIHKYETYKYHGQVLRCKKGIIYIPVHVGEVIPKTPPVYYQYQYTGNESYGYVTFTLGRVSRNLLVFGPSCLCFRSFGDRLPYDNLSIKVNNPKCDGSFFVSVQFEDNICGIYRETGGHDNWCKFSWAIQNPLGTLTNMYSKWSYKLPPLYLDEWGWFTYPSSWSFSYSCSWRYYPISKKYDIWDSEGRIIYNYNRTSFSFLLGSTMDLRETYYPGTCHRTLGVDFSNICFYMSEFSPPP